MAVENEQRTDPHASPAMPPSRDAPQRIGVICRQARHPIIALGIAVELMFRRKPFSDFRFGQVVSVIRGQIHRRHYLIAYRGEQPVGYSGWAECSKDVGERWLREGYLPAYEECRSGECAMLITVVSSENDTTIALIRAMRQRYPNRVIYFKRDYPGGKTRKSASFNRIVEGQDATSGGTASDARVD